MSLDVPPLKLVEEIGVVLIESGRGKFGIGEMSKRIFEGGEERRR